MLSASVAESAALGQFRQHPGTRLSLCDPTQNPDATAYFVTNFCRTLDEDGAARLIPPWGFILEDCATLDRTVAERRDIHDEKTRQMVATWLTAGQHLHRTMFLPGARSGSSTMVGNGPRQTRSSGGCATSTIFSRTSS